MHSFYMKLHIQNAPKDHMDHNALKNACAPTVLHVTTLAVHVPVLLAG